MSNNNPTFNSVLYDSHDGIATLIQVTIATTHTVKPEGLEAIKRIIPANTKYRYLAIVPQDVKLSCDIPLESKETIDMFWYALPGEPPAPCTASDIMLSDDDEGDKEPAPKKNAASAKAAPKQKAQETPGSG